MGGGRPTAAALRASPRHRHEPARLRLARPSSGAPPRRHGRALGADLLMSHFVSSEEPRQSRSTREQIARFEAARAAFPDLPACLANSSGMFLRERPAYDLARPGYALYGGNPTPGAPNPMKTVVTLEVAIQQTRWIEAGETCGYNQQWTARAPQPARHACSPATPTACRAAPARSMAAQARRSSSRGAAASWSGACRWTSASPTSPTCRRTPRGRA